MKFYTYAARFSSRMACAICMILLLASCASLPDIHYLKESIQAPPVPTIVGAHGSSLPEPEARRLLQRRLGDEAARLKEVAIEEAVTGRPLIKGNKVSLLIDGPRTMAAMMKAIAAARDHVNLETYIFDHDEVGLKFAELLKAKQREGVQVNIIYDSHGTLNTPVEFFDSMREAGIRLTEFNPLNPLKRTGSWRPNNRDHRKILIVDGKTAFTGGINISEDYSSASPSSARRSLSEPGWRDTHIQVEGPAVAALQSLFMDTWIKQRGERLNDRDYFPPLKEEGDEMLRIISTHPDGDYSVFKAYALAMQHAQQTIHITIAYFVPDQQVIDSLIAAAQRGVDVKLIFPSVTDVGLVYYAGRSFYQELLEGGVRIYELQESVLHAKTAVIDGMWSTVGSANLDMRSFLHNTEVNVIVLGSRFGKIMEDAFEVDLTHSREITLEEWKQRPASKRIKEWFSRLFSYWL
jgi:cardiolipin synthase